MCRCACWVGFKPGSDDVRDSPALDVAQILQGMGARVTIYDPQALGNAQRVCPDFRYATTTFDAARDAEVVLMLTEWAEFIALSPDALGEVVARRNIIDGRNALAPALWRDAGWDYRAPRVAVRLRYGWLGNGPVTDSIAVLQFRRPPGRQGLQAGPNPAPHDRGAPARRPGLARRRRSLRVRRRPR